MGTTSNMIHVLKPKILSTCLHYQHMENIRCWRINRVLVVNNWTDSAFEYHHEYGKVVMQALRYLQERRK